MCPPKNNNNNTSLAIKNNNNTSSISSSSSSTKPPLFPAFAKVTPGSKVIITYGSSIKFGITSRDAAGRQCIKITARVEDNRVVPCFYKESPCDHVLNGAVGWEVVSKLPTGVYGARKSARQAAKPPVPIDSVTPTPPAARPKTTTAPSPKAASTPSPRTPLPAAATPVVSPSQRASPRTASAPAAANVPTAIETEALDAADALSGIPPSLNVEQLFRLGRIPAPDAPTGLTGAYLRQAVLRPAPAGLPEAAVEALVKSTRQQHRNQIKTVAGKLDPSLPLDVALVTALQDLARERNWRQSTLKKNAATVQGALRILPLYHSGSSVIQLRDSPVWRLSMVTFQHRSKEELPNQPKAATWEQVRAAIKKTTNDAQAIALLLGWLTAARLGCIRTLSKEHVKWDSKGTSITFHIGKGARARGPYTVHAQPIPQEFRERWKKYFESRETMLFPRHLTGSSLKNALRTVDATLEQRSIRRGALQTMAQNGASEETLMRYSGHTQVATLRRYLNWNAINSKVQKEMVEVGKSLVRK